MQRGIHFGRKRSTPLHQCLIRETVKIVTRVRRNDNQTMLSGKISAD